MPEVVELFPIGMAGHETPDAVEADPGLLETLERIRGSVAVKLGLTDSWRSAAEQAPGVPFLSVLSTLDSSDDLAAAAGLRALGFAMRSVHRAYWVTGGVCTAVAAAIPGSVPSEVAGAAQGQPFRVRHPSGFLDVEVDLRVERSAPDGSGIQLRRAALLRTARRIMEGTVRLPEA